ncbi:Uncharacterized protein GBIM_13108, partial [Gryllus bimaculatus]
MAVLLRNVTNALWHAFAALAPPGSALVAKSRLKVLTANIGTLLDLYGVERGLDHFRSTLELNFHHFRYYLQREVVAHPAEVGAVASQLVTSLGLAWDAADFEALAQALGAFRFPTFLALLETRLAGAPAAEDPAGLREAVEELHQTFLLDVLKQPTELSYFKARGRDQCGCIALDPQCRVEAGAEGGGAGGAGVAATGAAAQRLVLTTRDRTIELAAPDH